MDKTNNFPKKILFISSFLLLFCFQKNNANSISYNNSGDNIYNKLLVGINFDAGFSGVTNEDFYLKYDIKGSATINGAQTDITGKGKSYKFNAEFNSGLNGGLSFDHVLNNGAFYGIEINYGQFKNVDPKYSGSFIDLNQKNLMIHGGYLFNFGIFFPYVMIGIGLDSIGIEGKIPVLESYDDGTLLGGLRLFKDFNYKKGGFSASIGSLVNINNIFFGVSYKFLGSINFKDDIYNNESNFNLSGNINQNLTASNLEFQKFLTQTHTISVSFKMAI